MIGLPRSKIARIEAFVNFCHARRSGGVARVYPGRRLAALNQQDDVGPPTPIAASVVRWSMKRFNAA